MSPAKPPNPPSIALGQQEDSQHNTSGLSSIFGAIQSVLQYQQIYTPQPFSPSQLQPAPSPVTSAIFHSSSTVKTSQPVQPAESAQISGLARTSHTNPALLRATRNFQKQLFSSCFPKTKKAQFEKYTSPTPKTKIQTQTHVPPTQNPTSLKMQHPHK